MNHNIVMSKYQGLGNDYLVLDPNKNKLQLRGKKIELLCRRGFGIGADGVLYGPLLQEGKLGVRIFNADGTEAEISGNGVRIFAKYLMDQEYVTGPRFSIETEIGPVEVECLNGRGTEFKIRMGKASFDAEEIPVLGEKREVIDELFCFNGREYKATCVSVGNPHCIIPMEQISKELVKELGPYVENDARFPHRMNLQICRVIDRYNVQIEIYERGSGYTRASGTGSCAVAAALYRKGLIEPRVNISQPGGIIEVDIEEDGTMYMLGTVGFIADVSIAESFFA